MSLKIGALPDRTPVKVTASLPPDVHEALQDYVAIHAREFGQEASAGDLAALMIEHFLNADAAFKRARKTLRQSSSKKE